MKGLDVVCAEGSPASKGSSFLHFRVIIERILYL